MEVVLQAYNVDADISLGFAGLGIFSDPNVYKDSVTGETFTHEQEPKAQRCSFGFVV